MTFSINKNYLHYEVFVWKQYRLTQIIRGVMHRHGICVCIYCICICSTRVTSPGRRPVQLVWRSWVAQTSRSPLSLTDVVQIECIAVHLASAWLQELPDGDTVCHPTTLGAPIWICVGFIP